MILLKQVTQPFFLGLIPCRHFLENFKNLQNLGGVKLKHLLEIQNIDETHNDILTNIGGGGGCDISTKIQMNPAVTFDNLNTSSI